MNNPVIENDLSASSYSSSISSNSSYNGSSNSSIEDLVGEATDFHTSDTESIRVPTSDSIYEPEDRQPAPRPISPFGPCGVMMDLEAFDYNDPFERPSVQIPDLRQVDTSLLRIPPHPYFNNASRVFFNVSLDLGQAHYFVCLFNALLRIDLHSVVVITKPLPRHMRRFCFIPFVIPGFLVFDYAQLYCTENFTLVRQTFTTADDKELVYEIRDIPGFPKAMRLLNEIPSDISLECHGRPTDEEGIRSSIRFVLIPPNRAFLQNLCFERNVRNKNMLRDYLSILISILIENDWLYLFYFNLKRENC
jgi:hypothetical protein